jgi:hypothetical protein
LTNRETLRIGRLRLCGVFLLTGMATASARAQIEALVPGFPLSTGLAPSLTDDPQTAPVTTLATDLLAPQRPYIFDPSGSSVISNALNPTLYSSSFSLSLVETDTQIRDSSQAGHLSPYTAAAQRLGLNFSGSEDSGSQDNRNTSNGSFRGALTGEGGNEPSATGNAYQSSWGGSSSFGPPAQGSSWGTGRMSVDRSGNQRMNSLVAAKGPMGGLAASGDSNGTALGNARGYSAAMNSKSSGRLSFGSNGRSTTNSSGYGSIGDAAQGAHSEDQPGQYSIRHMAGNDSGNSLAAMSGPSGDKAESAKHTLTFFPQASYNQSVLGESPFSSPAGVDELHFLNPNIYAATSQGQSLSIGEKGSATEDSLRQAFARRDHLAANASRYGLNTHPGTDRLAKVSGDKSELEKHSYLSTGLLDSTIP